MKRVGLSATIACVFLGVCWGTAAHGSENHVFNPRLSLTGECEPSAVDTVADPGCPYLAPPNGPSEAFSRPDAIATDSYGNIYVASAPTLSKINEGRVDVFDSDGFFITELANLSLPARIAVDSEGVLYVNALSPKAIARYKPSLYKPEDGEIEYGNPAEVIVESAPSTPASLVVHPENDHLFVHAGDAITEYGSATEGNVLLNSGIGDAAINAPGTGLAIDVSRGRIYANSTASEKQVITVLELDPPHNEVMAIDGSTIIPAKKFFSRPSVAVDEATGHFFAYDGDVGKVHEFEEDGDFVETIDHDFVGILNAGITVDNGANSENGALNSEGRFLFVPSHPTGTGHSFAFGPPEEFLPEVEISFSGVSETDAELEATINPGGLKTTYKIEYTTEQSFEEEGFEGATVLEEGELTASQLDVSVAASLSGLAPETAYRFRVVAENAKGPAEEEASFATYPAVEPVPPCPNDPLRTGFSALLPDCRAYELVTPPDTNARAPMGQGFLGFHFPTREASPAGEKLTFRTEGGTLPGNEGTGSLGGDPYLSSRGANGWSTTPAGPSGEETLLQNPGSPSPDQGYSFWESSSVGSKAVEGKITFYVRYPDGNSELIGRGSLGTDPQAPGRLISEGGGHIIFESEAELEEAAPAPGTNAIYDRTADEKTNVVSLLPGDVTPEAGKGAVYLGTSLDGEGVAFRVDGVLYLRHDNEETYEIGTGVTYAGIAEGGSRIFYVEAGDLMRFDAESEDKTSFTDSGDVTPVNVSADGSAAYFVSPTKITGEETNPRGDTAVEGEENLYLSREGVISFVGIVTKRDVEGEFNGTIMAEGLGLWTATVFTGRLAADPSRTTPEGNVLLFESRANLTGYDPGEAAQVYRYDSIGDTLECLSCNPTLAAPSGAASLQSISEGMENEEPLNGYDVVTNLRADGRRAFFQSSEPLVPGDVDELQDVYEWEDQGVGSCKLEGGCIYLISSGHSDRLDYLYAVSDSGDDVFFRTSDLLLGRDLDETPSIYDARVEGGFPEPPPPPICNGEGCRPVISPPPALPAPVTVPSAESGNVPRKCPKGKRRVVRHGKVRCVKRKKHRKHHQRRHQAAAQRGAGK